MTRRELKTQLVTEHKHDKLRQGARVGSWIPCTGSGRVPVIQVTFTSWRAWKGLHDLGLTFWLSAVDNGISPLCYHGSSMRKPRLNAAMLSPPRPHNHIADAATISKVILSLFLGNWFRERLQQENVTMNKSRVNSGGQKTTPNTYHVRAHLRTWPKNQFTLFIHVVEEAWELGRQRVGSGFRFIQQTLAIPSATGSRDTDGEPSSCRLQMGLRPHTHT